MTLLSDTTIARCVAEGSIGIDPFDAKYVGPCSYDLHIELPEPLWLIPNKFYLLSTQEYVKLPGNIQGQVHGRSSIGRKGVLVHFTAGFIDPGFEGQITLEVMALANAESLEPGDRVAQIAFSWLDKPAAHPYSGRYQGQRGPTKSRFNHGDA